VSQLVFESFGALDWVMKTVLVLLQPAHHLRAKAKPGFF
jgi:hypothetical protein